MSLNVLVVGLAIWSVGGLVEEEMEETDGEGIVINVILKLENKGRAVNLVSTTTPLSVKTSQENLSDTPTTIHAF